MGQRQVLVIQLWSSMEPKRKSWLAAIYTINLPD
jgi:hypothetical protein